MKLQPTAKEYYYGFECTIVFTGTKILIAAELIRAKQAFRETAMRVIHDALVVKTLVWILHRMLTTSLIGTITCWLQVSCRLPRMACEALITQLIHLRQDIQPLHGSRIQ